MWRLWLIEDKYVLWFGVKNWGGKDKVKNCMYKKFGAVKLVARTIKYWEVNKLWTDTNLTWKWMAVKKEKHKFENNWQKTNRNWLKIP